MEKETVMNSALNTVDTALKADTTNLITIIAFIILIGIIGYLLIRNGIIKYNGNKLQVGYSDNERKIIRLQIEYAHSELNIFFEYMIKQNEGNPNFVEWRARYSKELVFDVIVEAIALNHITTDEFYIKGKVIKIWAELAKLELSPQFNTEEFKGVCYQEVEKIIEGLVGIRNYYSKH